MSDDRIIDILALRAVQPISWVEKYHLPKRFAELIKAVSREQCVPCKQSQVMVDLSLSKVRAILPVFGQDWGKALEAPDPTRNIEVVPRRARTVFVVEGTPAPDGSPTSTYVFVPETLSDIFHERQNARPSVRREVLEAVFAISERANLDERLFEREEGSKHFAHTGHAPDSPDDFTVIIPELDEQKLAKILTLPEGTTVKDALQSVGSQAISLQLPTIRQTTLQTSPANNSQQSWEFEEGNHQRWL